MLAAYDRLDGRVGWLHEHVVILCGVLARLAQLLKPQPPSHFGKGRKTSTCGSKSEQGPRSCHMGHCGCATGMRIALRTPACTAAQKKMIGWMQTFVLHFFAQNIVGQTQFCDVIEWYCMMSIQLQYLWLYPFSQWFRDILAAAKSWPQFSSLPGNAAGYEYLKNTSLV